MLHLRAFRLNSLRGDPRANVSEDYAWKTARQWFDLTIRSDHPWEFFDRLRYLLTARDVFLDPIEAPVLEMLERLGRTPRGEAMHRLKGKTKGLAEMLAQRDYWLDANVSRRLADAVRRFEESTGKQSKG